MYLIEQETANQIAQSVAMKYPQMKALFQMTEEQADKWEMELRMEITSQTDEVVARVVAVYLPLYLENQAITNFINKTRNRALRTMMPEILTAEEAVLIAQMDILMITPEQKKKAIQKMKEYQNLLRKEND